MHKFQTCQCEKFSLSGRGSFERLAHLEGAINYELSIYIIDANGLKGLADVVRYEAVPAVIDGYRERRALTDQHTSIARTGRYR